MKKEIGSDYSLAKQPNELACPTSNSCFTETPVLFCNVVSICGHALVKTWRLTPETETGASKSS
jgi:hypothetical protein